MKVQSLVIFLALALIFPAYAEVWKCAGNTYTNVQKQDAGCVPIGVDAIATKKGQRMFSKLKEDAPDQSAAVHKKGAARNQAPLSGHLFETTSNRPLVDAKKPEEEESQDLMEFKGSGASIECITGALTGKAPANCKLPTDLNLPDALKDY
jgi:hypothetical protein